MASLSLILDIDLETLNQRSTGISFRTIEDSGIAALIEDKWSESICGKSIKASISRWHLIGIKTSEFDECVLVGFKDGYKCRVTSTSFVQAMAPDRYALLTENSLYELHDQAKGDPTPEQLTALVHAMNSWIGKT